MNNKVYKRGFTLIELLVVIAIIGILASVVLSSLNTARTKGKESAAKSSMSQARTAAEIIYSANDGSYADLCPDQATAAGGTATDADRVLSALVNAAAPLGVTFGTANYDSGNAATPDTIGDTSCQSDVDEYVIQILLSTGVAFCVDGVSFAGEITPKSADLASGALHCQ